MRELVLRNIENIGILTINFSNSMMKWKDFRYEETPIHEVNFSQLSDENLLSLYTDVIRQWYKSF